MNKICIIYNFAQKYREAIFSEIDQYWDCEWLFGSNSTDIKGMDLSKLKNVSVVNTIQLFGLFSIQKGISVLENNSGANTIIMLGEPFNLSSWHILIRNALRPRNKRKKIFLWTHGWYGRENLAKKWIKRIYFNLAHFIFTYGEFARIQAVKQGFDGQKIQPIHNSLDYKLQKSIRYQISNFDVYKDHFGNNNPNLVFIGRLTKVKRLDMLIKAISILDGEGFHVNLTLIGEGEESNYLKQLVHINKLTSRVWFYGACYDDTKNACLIYNADLCVAPGNVGLTAMHSMAYGTPVLTHNNFCMQMPEFEAIKDYTTGTFYDFNSIESLSQKIREWLIHNKGNRESIRQACYNEIEKNWSVPFQMNILKQYINHE